MPIDDRYPKNWFSISWAIRVVRSGGQCEFIYPSGNRCGALDGQPHPQTGSTVVLATCHLDHTPSNCDESNLVAYCQLHHNQHDRLQHAATLDSYRAQQRAEKEQEQKEAGQLKMDI